MGLMDFFSPEAGQDRRRWLDSQEAALAEALQYYLGPTGIPERLGVANEMLNPVVGLQRSAAATNRALDPSLGGVDRVAAGADAATEALGALLGVSGLRAATEAAAPAVERGLLEFAADESGSVPVSGFLQIPSAVSGLEQRAAGIVDLLRSGRADEITDAMLDLGDPVLNARLNEALWQNYDLPMDYASRMARADEMGLSGDRYHGTPYADIVAMRPSEFGAVGPGVYAAGRSNTASDYARGYGLMSPSNTFDHAGERFTVGGNVMPIRATENLQPFEDWTAARMADLQRQGLYGSSFKADAAASDAASDAGFAGVRARGDNVVIFDPRNIRSRFARFDPRLAHLKNLNAALAGGAGIPIGLLAMQPNEEQY